MNEIRPIRPPDYDDAERAAIEQAGYPAATAAQLARAAEAGPTATDPMRGLEFLSRVAVSGRSRLRELAAVPAAFVWSQIAVSGTIVLLAGGPGEGKTTLLFLLLVGRMNTGDAVHILGRRVEPAPPSTWVVLIEGEHSESSAARKLLRSCVLLDVDDAALDRIILVARKAVRLGSPEWHDVVKLVRAGLVSDIAIDTIARVAPGDGNDEKEQVAIFDHVAQAIEAAPDGTAKPTVWAAAHTRKNGRTCCTEIARRIDGSTRGGSRPRSAHGPDHSGELRKLRAKWAGRILGSGRVSRLLEAACDGVMAIVALRGGKRVVAIQAANAQNCFVDRVHRRVGFALERPLRPPERTITDTPAVSPGRRRNVDASRPKGR